MIDPIIIIKYRTGIPDHISINLWPIRSIIPPKNPCNAPANIPTIEENIVRMNPKIIEILNPYISLANTSLA